MKNIMFLAAFLVAVNVGFAQEKKGDKKCTAKESSCCKKVEKKASCKKAEKKACCVKGAGSEGKGRKYIMSPKAMMEHAKRELSLTVEQQEQWRGIHDKYKAIKEETRRAMRSDLEAVLTDEQKVKFAAMKEKRMNRRED